MKTARCKILNWPPFATPSVRVLQFPTRLNSAYGRDLDSACFEMYFEFAKFRSTRDNHPLLKLNSKPARISRPS